MNVLRALEGVRRVGDGQWLCFCPVHEKPSNGHQRSLSVSQGDDGRVLVHCHSGCRLDQICAALNLKVGDLFSGEPRTSESPKRRAHRIFKTPEDAFAAVTREVRGTFVQAWTYPGGTLMVARFLLDDGGKTYRPIHRHGDGWVIGDPAGPLPLYRGDGIPGSGPVIVVEGEKCADAAATIGLAGVTSAHGAEAAAKTDWSPLAGRDVIILPDNDTAGTGYAEEVASILSRLTPPARVKVVVLPDLPEGGDICDWLEALDAREPESLRAAILDMAEAASVWAPAVDKTPAGNPAKGFVSVSGDGEGQTRMITAYQPFPVEQLPEPARRLVLEGALAIGCDPAFIALPLLSGLAAAIGNSRVITLKPGWNEPSVIWTASVGESGMQKSPAMEKAVDGLSKLQAEQFRKHADAMRSHKEEKLRYDADLAEWRKAGRKRGQLPPEPPEEPLCVRYMVSDTTLEALVCTLSHNDRGVLLARDELSGWVESFDAYRDGRGGDVAHYLSMHRAGPVTVDRKSGEKRTVHVPRAAVSVTGGIQPKVLARVLGTEHVDDGLLARMLFAAPPRRERHWTEEKISTSTCAAVHMLYQSLLTLQPDMDAEGVPSPRFLTLTRDARELWIRFFEEHGREQATLSGDLASAWSKLEGYCARIALVIHLVRAVSNRDILHDQVDDESMQAAIHLTRWFGREARRVYGLFTETDEEREQRQLVEWIRMQGGSVSVRDTMRSGPCFKTKDEATAALDRLVKDKRGKWACSTPSPEGGRPSQQFTLTISTDTDKTLSDAPVGGFVSQGGVDSRI